MKTHNSALIKILVFSYLSVLCVSQGFDFFYFVQQWPGSLCDTTRSCCYPTKGKPPVDFGIHGLWPTFNNASYPSNCNDNNPYDQSRGLLENEWSTLACPRNNGTKF
ncbi:Ribonuclease T2-like [Parasponia andersonii]|uniref:Ribonuclease T2-like n=1 Tax=Parasponia andersonii TaxID=3476 RepID=A0A2P5CBB2_PARAD|nr:Ribonuclease T2-like [Parasponia andersonii]